MDILERTKRLAQSAEIYTRQEKKIHVHFEGRNLQNIQADYDYGRALRIFKDGRIGFAHTTQEGIDHDKALVKRALAVAPYGQVASFTMSQKASILNTHQLYQAPKELETEDVVKIANDTLDSLYEKHHQFGWSVIARYQQGHIHLANTEGFDGQYNYTRLVLIISGLYMQKNDILHYHKQWNGNQYPDTLNTFITSTDRDLQKVDRLIDVNPGTYQVIFSPSATSLLLHTLIVPITGKNLINRTPHMIDARMTLIDDPTSSNGSQVIPFDDEGVITRSKVLFKEGLFVEGIHSLATAKAVGHQPTGNGFRTSYAKIPKPKITNLFLSPGNQSITDIIANIKNGLYIIMLGGTINSDFQNCHLVGTVSLGYRIVNGECVGRIKNVTVNLDGPSVLKEQVIAVSSEREWVNSSLLPAIVIERVFIGTLS
ncbi:MAG: TldD/PmbA family protein [Candidatus Parabeggiatoa sp.]|nr:TldD/PmbA family protein [Candidatus Parabeggiatoa sp.]